MGVIIGSTPLDPLLAGDNIIKFGATGLNGTSQGTTHTADWVNGQAGNDYIFGAAGDDILIGGGGDDTLNGGNDNDRLSGGTGNDFLDGNFGQDFLRGGSGRDVFLWDANDFIGVWNTVSDPFAVGSSTSFNIEGSHGAGTTSTYAGNEDFDVIKTTTVEGSGTFDLSGKNISTIEAVAAKATDNASEHVIASLAEARSENQSVGSSGSGAGRDTVMAAVLGDDEGDIIDLMSDGQPWVFNPEATAVALSASEIQSLRSVVGSLIHIGADENPNTVDLFAYVFTNGDASITLWTDVNPASIFLDGSSIGILG